MCVCVYIYVYKYMYLANKAGVAIFISNKIEFQDI